MKTILTLIILATLTFRVESQSRIINVCENCNNRSHIFDFNSLEDSTRFFFYIDSTQTNNIWQLGSITKPNFSLGNRPRGFITDTINPYPVGNISSFQFSIKNCEESMPNSCGGYQAAYISIYTKIDSDTTLDGGTIEVSHNGSPWINLIRDSLSVVSGYMYSLKDTVKSLGKPGFSGTMTEWKAISISYAPEMQSPFDVISLRFTFASDSIDTHKNGWVISSVFILGIYEGILKTRSTSTISVFPNPVNNQLEIVTKDNIIPGCEISIVDYLGRVVLVKKNFSSNIIDVSSLNNGMYILKYSNKRDYSIVRFNKQGVN